MEGEPKGQLDSTWESITKDNEGEAHIHTLHKYVYPPDPVDIESALVRRAPAAVIRPSRRVKPQSTEQETLVFGDAQIPFHDDRALGLAQTAIRELMPNNIVFVGDMLDLPSMSRFEQRPEWQQTTQAAIDKYHEVLAQTRANAPDANIYVVHGNHEARLDSYVRKNAAEVFGLKRANAQNELAVLTLQYLVRYDELEIQSIDGYPNGTLWLEDNLKFVHGTNVRKGGSNAAKYLAEERETTIYGHTHRLELAQRTFPTRLGKVVISAASPGALCLTDGSVPGFNHTVTSGGEVVKKAEDWQQGLLQIHHEGEHHDITPVQFTERGMILNGKRYDHE